jgi:hypothetical protein
MLTPLTLAIAYLAVNLAILVWLERERAGGRMPARRVAAASNALRYGPPLVGAVYLVTMAGDWLFVLFVLAFFAGAFWLMDGLLSTIPSGSSERMRGDGWQDPGAGASRGTDRDRP